MNFYKYVETKVKSTKLLIIFRRSACFTLTKKALHKPRKTTLGTRVGALRGRGMP
jgi:predicted thioesterase